MATATAPAAKPMTWRHVIEDRQSVLLGARDPRTGQYHDSALSEQIEFGLRQLGLGLLGGPVSPDQFNEFRSVVLHAFWDAQKQVVNWAVTYAEANWPEGPGSDA